MRAALLLAALLIAGCGNDGALRVSAAASLKTALPAYDEGARYSFAGSDELAAQIRGGARPDVFAAANTELPEQLHREGLVERPVVFATNRLVLAVPARGGEVLDASDLAAPGTKIAIGSETVPVGIYSRELIARLPRGDAILANVRSNEPDAAGVMGKLTQGAVDAGFVYATDLLAARDRLREIDLPANADVAYAAAVVKGTEHEADARAFVIGLRGAGALTRAGFGAP
jgi:molybdate transport system substrate-binding protein